MKRKIRMLTSIMLTVILILSVIGISGCGNSKPNNQPVSSSNTTANTDTSKQEYKFVLITMDSIYDYWLSVKKGAEDKAKELGNVSIIFRAPTGTNKSDPAIQVSLMEDAINQKPDAILLAPLDVNALAPSVKRAMDAKIPVIDIDSPVNADVSSFIATDNYKAGKKAADKLGELIGGKGTVGLINTAPGIGTTTLREKGFRDEMKEKFPDVKILPTLFCEGDKVKAMNQAIDILTAHPDVVGFFAVDEQSTLGVIRAIEQKNLVGKVKIVGFDTSPDILNAIKKGSLNATIMQNPYKMGYLGVQFAYDILQGKEVPKRVDTGVKVITKENISEAE